MRAIELFAGVGGFRIGLTKAGHEVVWANEWDKYAADTYDYNFLHRHQATGSAEVLSGASSNLTSKWLEGAIQNHASADFNRIDRRSITDVPATEIPDHDIICGGFPCQAFSIAGKRRGFEETRGTLFFDIMRIAQHHRTPYLFLENVKGLLNHDGGRTFEVILETLDESGYDCQWQVLNSKNFGVPQNRERIIIIANLRGKPRPEVFPITGEDNNLDEERSGSEPMVIGSSQKHAAVTRNGIVPTLSSAMGLGGGQTPMIQQLNQPNHSNDRVYGTDGISPTLNTMQGGNRQPFIEVGKIRRLTPMECERLQAFPDNWTKYGLKPDGTQYEQSDTQRYKQMGNAVTTNVIEAVARRLA